MKILRKSTLKSSFIRWALVGILTTGLDYVLFLIFYSRFESVFFANLMSSLFATTLNYFVHSKWTFKSDQLHSKTGIKYFLSLAFWWILSTVLIKFLILVGIEVIYAKLFPIILMIPMNYQILKKYVFKHATKIDQNLNLQNNS